MPYNRQTHTPHARAPLLAATTPRTVPPPCRDRRQIVVDLLFLFLFVVLHDDERYSYFFSFGTNEDAVWKAMRFLRLPRKHLIDLVGVMGVVTPLRYCCEREYQASLADARWQAAHSDRATLQRCPFGAQQAAPCTLVEYVRLRDQLFGNNGGVLNQRARSAMFEALREQMEAACLVLHAESRVLYHDERILHVTDADAFDCLLERVGPAERALRRQKLRQCQAFGWPLASSLTYLLAAEFLKPAALHNAAGGSAMPLQAAAPGRWRLIWTLWDSLFPLMVVLAAAYAVVLAPMAATAGPRSWLRTGAPLLFFALVGLLLYRSLWVVVRIMPRRAAREIKEAKHHAVVRPTKDNATELCASFSAMVQMVLLAATLFPKARDVTVCSSLEPLLDCDFPFTYSGRKHHSCIDSGLPSAAELGYCWPGNSTALDRLWPLHQPSALGGDATVAWCASRGDIAVAAGKIAGLYSDTAFFSGHYAACACTVPADRKHAVAMARLAPLFEAMSFTGTEVLKETLSAQNRFVGSFVSAAVLALLCLLTSAGWINTTVLTVLDNESTTLVRRRIGRLLFFDFATGSPAFRRREWLAWAVTVRRRLLRLIGKASRQRTYATLAAETVRRNLFVVLTKAAFIPITSAMVATLDCVEEQQPDGTTALVLAQAPGVQCWKGAHPWFALVALFVLIFYLPVATISPGFTALDSDGKSMPSTLDVRVSVSIQFGQKATAIVLVSAKHFLSRWPMLQLAATAVASTAMVVLCFRWPGTQVCSISQMVLWLRLMYALISWTSLCAVMAWTFLGDPSVYYAHFGGCLLILLGIVTGACFGGQVHATFARATHHIPIERSDTHVFQEAQAATAVAWCDVRSVRRYSGMNTLLLGKSDSTCTRTELACAEVGHAISTHYIAVPKTGRNNSDTSPSPPRRRAAMPAALADTVFEEKVQGAIRRMGAAAGFRFGIWSGLCLLPESGPLNAWQKRKLEYTHLHAARNRASPQLRRSALQPFERTLGNNESLVVTRVWPSVLVSLVPMRTSCVSSNLVPDETNPLYKMHVYSKVRQQDAAQEITVDIYDHTCKDARRGVSAPGTLQKRFLIASRQYRLCPAASRAYRDALLTCSGAQANAASDDFSVDRFTLLAPAKLQRGGEVQEGAASRFEIRLDAEGAVQFFVDGEELHRRVLPETHRQSSSSFAVRVELRKQMGVTQAMMVQHCEKYGMAYLGGVGDVTWVSPQRNSPAFTGASRKLSLATSARGLHCAQYILWHQVTTPTCMPFCLSTPPHGLLMSPHCLCASSCVLRKCAD